MPRGGPLRGLARSQPVGRVALVREAGRRILGDFEVVYPAGDDATPGQDDVSRATPATSTGRPPAAAPSPAIPAAPAGSAATGASARLRGRRFAPAASTSRDPAAASFCRATWRRPARSTCPGSANATSRSTAAPIRPPPHRTRCGWAGPGPQTSLLALEHSRIRKGAFEEYHAIARDRVWPYVEKISVAGRVPAEQQGRRLRRGVLSGPLATSTSSLCVTTRSAWAATGPIRNASQLDGLTQGVPRVPPGRAVTCMRPASRSPVR